MFMRKFKIMVVACCAILAILASGVSAPAQSTFYNLRMENHTGYNMYELRLSSVNDPSWERDLLGAGVFEDGNTFTVTRISPGRYDIAFVDEDADVCVLHNVPIFSNLNWDLSQSWLLGCELTS
jgi:hypothetical protein